MANSNEKSKVIQVALPNELNDKLDAIASRAHVAKSVLLRMGAEKVIKMVEAGEIKLGISFG